MPQNLQILGSFITKSTYLMVPLEFSHHHNLWSRSSGCRRFLLLFTLFITWKQCIKMIRVWPSVWKIAHSLVGNNRSWVHVGLYGSLSYNYHFMAYHKMYLVFFGGGGYDTYIQWLVAMFLIQFKCMDVHTCMHAQV